MKIFKIGTDEKVFTGISYQELLDQWGQLDLSYVLITPRSCIEYDSVQDLSRDLELHWFYDKCFIHIQASLIHLSGNFVLVDASMNELKKLIKDVRDIQERFQNTLGS